MLLLLILLSLNSTDGMYLTRPGQQRSDVTLTQSLLLQRGYRSLHHGTIPDSGRRGSQVQDGREQGWPAPVAEEEERQGRRDTDNEDGTGEIVITEDRESPSERGGRGASASGDSRDGRPEHGGRGAQCER